jgi:hypothetical protein
MQGSHIITIEMIWLVGWLVGWLAGWLVGWVGWLVGWLVGWSVGWLVRWLVGWLAGWFVAINQGCTDQLWNAIAMMLVSVAPLLILVLLLVLLCFFKLDGRHSEDPFQ